MSDLDDVGIVVIGRNEGQRLMGCLGAICPTGLHIVYVDSGSTDGSADQARQMGVNVIVLDDRVPFTAARGRNAGFVHLTHKFPELRFVQFLDGDCEISPAWLKTAARALRSNIQLVMVCGRRREQFPELSIYNRLCDMEWNTSIGETNTCGGDFMVRVTEFSAVGGFNESLIAGEEPELCWRLRVAGGTIERLPVEMTVHDANLKKFHQWWKRQVRAGHAAAENADLHGRVDGKHYVRNVASNLAYGIVIPAVAAATAYFSVVASVLFLVAVYSQLFFRVLTFRRQRADPSSNAALYAVFTVLVKFPQTFGALVYAWRRKVLKRQSGLIEYKEY